MLYQYYAHGKLRQSGTDKTHVNMEYDDFAHQIKLIDPDAGGIIYEHNSFGELTHQEDANGSTFEMQYNGIGQITQKEANGGVANAANGGFITTYSYMPQGPATPTNPPTIGNSVAAGKIDKILKDDGVNHEISYIYNPDYGDVESYTQTEPNYTMVTNYYAYDDMGRVTEMTFPSGYKLIYNYHGSTGDMLEIKGQDGSSNPVLLWSNPVKNVLGQPMQFTYGNPANNLKKEYGYDATTHMPTEIKITDGTVNPLWGQRYVFDTGTGNLMKRENMVAGSGGTLSETFLYKSNLQLEKSSSPGSTFAVGYGADGNINEKDDIGTYSYDDPVKAHAVTSILPTPGVKYTLPIFTQDITYTAFNKTLQINENDKVLDLTYGPDEQRVYTKLTDNANGNTKILYEKYFAPNFEHYPDAIQNVGGKDVHYVQSPFGLVAVIVKENTNPYEINFIGNDYLGSITHVMSESGGFINKYSYDGWGRRRSPDDWKVYDDGNPAPAFLKFGRGYTGHEHLEEFGLINMNGRMYDAAMAKMLSPDNFNNLPYKTIGLNRYAYAANNPFKYTDPYGHILGEILGIAAAAVAITTSTAAVVGLTAFTTVSSVYSNPISSCSASWLFGTIQNGDIKEGDRRARNAWEIWGGLFQYDRDDSRKGPFWHHAGALASRFTWEAPQTLSGLLVTQGANTVGMVDDVEYFHGATVAWGVTEGDAGFTLGSYINLSSEDGDANLILGEGGYTTMHEYGHYLQSKRNGPMYLFKHAAQSALGDADWTEKDANLRSAKYFHRVDNSFTWDQNYYTLPSRRRYSLFPDSGVETNAQWWEIFIPFTFTGP